MIVLSPDTIKCINQSILCWLATVDEIGMPNVSPKEIFNYCTDKVIIAIIASPNSLKNIISNNKSIDPFHRCNGAERVSTQRQC